MTAVNLKLDPLIRLTDEQFYQLCQTNRDLRLERTATKEIIVMAPSGGETGDREGEIFFQVKAWNNQNLFGKVFSPSTGFRLLNGAIRSPDACWLPLERWEVLTSEQRQKFPPLCPDFVVELRSASDELQPLQEKMQEYLNNGLPLGWLIDPQNRQVEIYRPGIAVEVLQTPLTLSGEDVLPGFVLNLSGIY